MGHFFLRFLFLFLFLFLVLKKEFEQRKLAGLSPKNLRELFNSGSKWKKGSDPKVSALLFALSAFVGFSLWEGLIISVLNLIPWYFLSALVGIASAVFLMRERKVFHPWTLRETLWGAATLGLISGSFLCWIFFPWVYFRARFLPRY